MSGEVVTTVVSVSLIHLFHTDDCVLSHDRIHSAEYYKEKLGCDEAAFVDEVSKPRLSVFCLKGLTKHLISLIIHNFMMLVCGHWTVHYMLVNLDYQFSV